MITLAVASAFLTLASQLSDFTGGEDGLTFKVPEALQPGTEYLDEPFLGASIDGRFLTYYLLFFVAARCSCWRCCASSTRRSAACCRRSARTTSAPRRSATAPSSTARSPACLGPVRDARRRAARALAALQRAGHDALVRDHARRAADRRDRRHGHDLRRGRRQRAVRAGAELPAGPDEARRRARCRTCRCSRRSSRPTAGCSGSASCSCSRSTTSRAASSAACGRCAARRRRRRPRAPQAAGRPPAPASASGPRAPPDRSA